MYLEFYGLIRAPFEMTPDPAFLYLGESHQEGLATLVYGVQARKGFVLLTGEVGTGKTTLLHSLLAQLDPSTVQSLTDTFVPMLWGTGIPPDLDFLKDHEGDVMGFNEPDQYGPACCNCDGKQSYYPATSSGWAPLFNPASAAVA